MTNGRNVRNRTRHLHVRYFFIKDRIAQNEVRLEHMPCTHMVADLFTKPVTGKLFLHLRNIMLGHVAERAPP